MQIQNNTLDLWNTDGVLKVLNFFDRTTINKALKAVDHIQECSADNLWMSHYELVNGKKQLCRVENFVPFHPDLRSIVYNDELLKWLSQLLGKPVCLYKEKINFKLPGGAGYNAHQDAPAYPHLQNHITCMIPLDSTNTANGCLEFAKKKHLCGIFPTNKNGCLKSEIEKDFQWLPCSLEPRDIVFFTSLTPHRSGPNTSNRARRAIFLTYNAQSEGDLRSEYYKEKERAFKHSELNEKNTRLSLIGHFQGKAPQ